MYYYFIYGLQIESEIPIPQWIPLLAEIKQPEVKISLQTLPEHLPQAEKQGVFFQSMPGDFLLNLDPIARYRVTGGDYIGVDILDWASIADAALFLSEAVMGALLQQRNGLVFHASAVASPMGALVFMGPSGAGKSVIVAGLVRRGYRFLSDELCALAFSEEGDVCVLPGNPKIGLWKDGLALFPADHTIARCDPVRNGLEKYWLNMENEFMAQPVHVHKIYMLQVRSRHGIEVEHLHLPDKFKRLMANIYMATYADGLVDSGSQFPLVTQVIKQVTIAGLIHPNRRNTFSALLDTVAEEF